MSKLTKNVINGIMVYQIQVSQHGSESIEVPITDFKFRTAVRCKIGQLTMDKNTL